MDSGRHGVERNFAWLGKNRRLSKDYERVPRTSEAFIWLVHIRRTIKFAKYQLKQSLNLLSWLVNPASIFVSIRAKSSFVANICLRRSSVGNTELALSSVNLMALKLTGSREKSNLVLPTSC